MTDKKPSVKEELRKIKESRKEQEAAAPAVEKNTADKGKKPVGRTEHKQPTVRKKPPKQKEAR